MGPGITVPILDLHIIHHTTRAARCSCTSVGCTLIQYGASSQVGSPALQLSLSGWLSLWEPVGRNADTNTRMTILLLPLRNIAPLATRNPGAGCVICSANSVRMTGLWRALARSSGGQLRNGPLAARGVTRSRHFINTQSHNGESYTRLSRFWIPTGGLHAKADKEEGKHNPSARSRATSHD